MNFNALRHIDAPQDWVEKALAAQPSQKPFFLRWQFIGAAAVLVITAAAVCTLLLHAGSSTPLSPDAALRTSPVVTVSTAPPNSTGASVAVSAAAATENTAAAENTAATAAQGTTAAVSPTAPPKTAAQPTQAPPKTAASAAPPDTEPAATLEPWQPFSTEPPEPLEPGVGEPDDPPLTYPPQPVWDGSIEIQIAASSRFFDSSAVYIHLHNWEEEKPVWPIRSPQEQLHFSVVGADKKIAVYPGNGLIRQFDHYHMMVYDRRGQVQDFYFCIRPRANVPDTLEYILE